MKYFTFLFMLFSISLVCLGQRKIKKVEVKEVGFNVKLDFRAISSEITHDGIQYKFTPISCDKLNAEFINESSFNGKFEYSYFENSRESYFMGKKKRKKEKTDSEFLKEGARWLLDNENINQEEFDNLIGQITYYFNEETGSDLNNIENATFSNPYSIGNKFLNVFKVEITNTTNSFKVLDDKIIIESGNQTQEPLSNEDIREFLYSDKDINSQKIQSLDRHNISFPLSIPPNSKFVKYLAILPIDYKNNTLMISILGNENKLKWEIVREEKNFDENFNYYEFNVEYIYNEDKSEWGINFNILKYPQTMTFIDNDLLLIEENHLSEKIEIFTYSLYLNKLFFNRNSFIGSELIDNVKNRRNPLEIKTTKIADLKKAL
jgi:hypothetical protein